MANNLMYSILFLFLLTHCNGQSLDQDDAGSGDADTDTDSDSDTDSDIGEYCYHVLYDTTEQPGDPIDLGCSDFPLESGVYYLSSAVTVNSCELDVDYLPQQTEGEYSVVVSADEVDVLDVQHLFFTDLWAELPNGCEEHWHYEWEGGLMENGFWASEEATITDAPLSCDGVMDIYDLIPCVKTRRYLFSRVEEE